VLPHEARVDLRIMTAKR